MTVKQIYEIVNAVTQQTLGSETVINEDLSNVVDITDPPYSLKKEGISVPPPKNDIRKGVFVIIISC